jgi:methionyl-tRNA synthetase
LVKNDKERAAAVIYTGLRVIDTLKVLFSPFLPHSSQQLHELLGYQTLLAPQPRIEDAPDKDGGSRQVLSGDYTPQVQWAPSQLPVGQTLQAPVPLFRKLEETVVDEELVRLRAS